jgi:hypothetical protein
MIVGALIASRESCQQLAMDAAEAAVAHHEDMVAGARLGDDRTDERLEIVMDGGLRAKRRQRTRDIPAEVGRGEAIRPVRFGEASRQRVFIAPTFIVRVRGSITARIRARPISRRSPRSSSRSPLDDARNRRKR